MIIATVFVFWLLFVEFRMTGGRHTPALYFLLYMSALMIVSDLLAGVTPFSVDGFFFLAIVSGMFWLGHLCGALIFGNADALRPHPSGVDGDDRIIEILVTPPVPYILNIIVLAGTLGGILALIALWQAAKSGGLIVTGIGDLAKLPAYFSALRYTPGVEEGEPTSVRFFMLAMEAGSAAAGILRAFGGTRRQHMFQALPLGVAFLMTLMTGSRSYVFLNCTWFFGSFIAILCVQGGVFKQLRSPGFLLKAGVFLIAAFLFGSAFSLLRYAAENLQQPTLNQLWTQLLPIMASSLAAIVTATLVFDRVTHLGVSLHLAAYTFAPVMAWFGLESVRYPPTVYLTNGLSDSNQYALIGYLLMDFGAAITAIIFFLTGFFAAVAVRLVRAGVLSMLPFVIAVMCVILFSLITNFFFYTTHVALFVGMTLAVIVIQRLRTRTVLA